MLAQTGCDAVMVGRAAVGNPYIFTQINAMARGEQPEGVDPAARFRVMTRYLEAGVNHYGETHACLMMRSRLGWFAKGLPHAGRFRESVKRITSRTSARRLIDDYERLVQETLRCDGPPSPRIGVKQ